MPKIKKKARIDPAAMTQSFSKNLLGLKFMQRAQNKTNNSRDNDYFSDDLDDDDDDNHELTKEEKVKRCLFNPSYVFCERLRFGRFSFQGMNMDIEALMFNNNELNTSLNESSNKNNSVGGGKKRSAPSSSSSDDTSGASGGEELDEDE